MPTPPQTAITWTEQKALASDGTPFAWFGAAVAISGSTAFIGARNAEVNGAPTQGAVYVFTRSGNGTWRQSQKLVGSGSSAGDQFGALIALHGNIALVAAPNATVGGNIWAGAVHVFTRSTENRGWTEIQKLTASDSAAFNNFGSSVEFNNEYAFIGAGGASNQGTLKPRKVYVFRKTDRTGSPWTQVQVIDDPNPTDANTGFGSALAASTDLLMVGARSTTLAGNIGQGMVYPYRLNNGTWSPEGKLSDAHGSARDNFGSALAIQGYTVLIGAPGAVVGGNQGAVYRYDLEDEGWRQVQKLVPTDGASPALFGAALSMSGDLALVGAYAEEHYRGAAYVFQLKNGMFGQSRRLTASDAEPNDVFGHYVAVDGTSVVGAYPKKHGSNVQQGAAYFYDRPSIGSASGTADT